LEIENGSMLGSIKIQAGRGKKGVWIDLVVRVWRRIGMGLKLAMRCGSGEAERSGERNDSRRRKRWELRISGLEKVGRF
jgi:hypothetical protein